MGFGKELVEIGVINGEDTSDSKEPCQLRVTEVFEEVIEREQLVQEWS